MSEPLMILPPHALEAAKMRNRFKWRGHAAQPGTGPQHETCRSCKHIERKYLAKTYIKCGIGRQSGGPGTDIRASDPACAKWEAVL